MHHEQLSPSLIKGIIPANPASTQASPCHAFLFHALYGPMFWPCLTSIASGSRIFLKYWSPKSTVKIQHFETGYYINSTENQVI